MPDCWNWNRTDQTYHIVSIYILNTILSLGFTWGSRKWQSYYHTQFHSAYPWPGAWWECPPWSSWAPCWFYIGSWLYQLALWCCWRISTKFHRTPAQWTHHWRGQQGINEYLAYMLSFVPHNWDFDYACNRNHRRIVLSWGPHWPVRPQLTLLPSLSYSILLYSRACDPMTVLWWFRCGRVHCGNPLHWLLRISILWSAPHWQCNQYHYPLYLPRPSLPPSIVLLLALCCPTHCLSTSPPSWRWGQGHFYNPSFCTTRCPSKAGRISRPHIC